MNEGAGPGCPLKKRPRVNTDNPFPQPFNTIRYCRPIDTERVFCYTLVWRHGLCLSPATVAMSSPESNPASRSVQFAQTESGWFILELGMSIDLPVHTIASGSSEPCPSTEGTVGKRGWELAGGKRLHPQSDPEAGYSFGLVQCRNNACDFVMGIRISREGKLINSNDDHSRALGNL